jgi:hypothetical protein
MKAIALASYSDGVGRAYQAQAAESSASALFWLITAFSRSGDETEIRVGEGNGDSYLSVPQLLKGPRNHKTKPIIAAGAQ